MSTKGFDCAQDCSAHGQQIKDAGYEFVVRYTYSLTHSSKDKLTRAEALHLSSMGIYLVTVFENAGDHAGYFKYSQGSSDGLSAFNYAFVTVKQPEATPVYFAVDYDATEQDLQQRVIPYFQAIRSYRGGYHVGVYGSGFVCRRLKELGLVSFTWLAQPPGWAESDYQDYNLKQLMPSKTFHGLDIDEDISNGNGGGWQVR